MTDIAGSEAAAPAETGATDSQDQTLPPMDPGFGDEESAEEEDTGPKEKITVNGKTYEVSLDELKAAAQREIAGTSKLEVAKKEIAEARDMKAQFTKQQSAVKSLLTLIASGNIESLADFVDGDLAKHVKGANPDTFKRGLVDYVQKLYQQSKMTPEQREGVEAKKEAARLRQHMAERDKSEQQKQDEYQINLANEHINIEYPKAIAAVGLPDTPFIKSQIMSTWRDAIERGHNPTCTAVAAHVKKELEAARMMPQQGRQQAARPKATPQSVHKDAPRESSQYTSFEDMVRARR